MASHSEEPNKAEAHRIPEAGRTSSAREQDCGATLLLRRWTSDSSDSSLDVQSGVVMGYHVRTGAPLTFAMASAAPLSILSAKFRPSCSFRSPLPLKRRQPIHGDHNDTISTRYPNKLASEQHIISYTRTCTSTRASPSASMYRTRSRCTNRLFL